MFLAPAYERQIPCAPWRVAFRRASRAPVQGIGPCRIRTCESKPGHRTRDGCIRQAVLGTVESFLDLESAHAVHTRLRRLTADRDDDLLVAVLEEVIYLLDTVGETPVDLRLRDVDGGVDVTFATTDASTLVQVGAVPKAVSLNELRFSQGRHGWRCAVTLDV